MPNYKLSTISYRNRNYKLTWIVYSVIFYNTLLIYAVSVYNNQHYKTFILELDKLCLFFWIHNYWYSLIIYFVNYNERKLNFSFFSIILNFILKNQSIKKESIIPKEALKNISHPPARSTVYGQGHRRFNGKIICEGYKRSYRGSASPSDHLQGSLSCLCEMQCFQIG